MITITLLLEGFIVLVYLFYASRKRALERLLEKEEERRAEEALERQRREEGLIKYTDYFGRTFWAKPFFVRTLEENDARIKEKVDPLLKVIETIESFKPERKYEQEKEYQLELLGYLKSRFKKVHLEKQKGSSRPDIVIEENDTSIALELKGPTTHEELKTIADKVIRYIQHFDYVLIILFDIKVKERLYREWKEGIKKNFPQIEILEGGGIKRHEKEYFM